MNDPDVSSLRILPGREFAGGVTGVIPEDLRRFNRALVLERLFQSGSLSRTALAAATGLTRAAISRITDELLHAGMIREEAQATGSGGRGRPQIGIELEPGGAYVIGVGIGAYEQWIRLTNLRGDCVERKRLALLRARAPAQALEQVAEAAQQLLCQARIPERCVVGLVAAVAGVVNHLEGLVVDSPNIGWHDVPVRKALREDLRLPVHVEAMHHTLNLAEARVQRGRAIDDAVLVNIAMGIGASVMQEGRIVRGRHAAAGQIGHMHVAGATELCTCGRRGCLDTVASGYAVLRRLGRVPARRIPREHRPADAGLLIKAIAQAARGESDVKRAFGACGEQLGEALNAVRAVVDPEHIWLAGPLAQAESFVEGVLSRFDVAARGDNDKVMPKLALSSLSSDAAAALLALKLFAFGPALDLARARA